MTIGDVTRNIAIATKTKGFAQHKEANKHLCCRIIELVLDDVIIRSTVKFSSDRFISLSYIIAFRIKGNRVKCS